MNRIEHNLIADAALDRSRSEVTAKQSHAAGQWEREAVARAEQERDTIGRFPTPAESAAEFRRNLRMEDAMVRDLATAELEEPEAEELPETTIARCPECGGQDFDVREYDFGVDLETGYHDAGLRFYCRCGATGEDGDLERVTIVGDLEDPQEGHASYAR
jgi:hypothetical protein